MKTKLTPVALAAAVVAAGLAVTQPAAAQAPAATTAYRPYVPPVPPPTAVPPDPKSITALLEKDYVWTKDPLLGQQQAPLFGDPSKPGPYGVLIKWPPGQFSHPHTHSTDRWAYVAKGTWWVSSSSKRDIATTWPVPQGSFGIDLANQVHWDGAKDEEVVLVVIGVGPIDSKLAEEK